MGVITTPNLYKSLTFDGASSRTYGVFITGEAVFNAPKRAVEMISIPGRNGAYALDQGYFENIEVTYPAGIFAENEADFADAISNFRNYLCSRSGYCRLTDDYNPNEYRLAVYKSGLEVTPAQLKAGEFNITFECKPQRFLTSGETKTTLVSGGTITNPTLFASKPMLEVYGYGDITVGNYGAITVENVPLGIVTVALPVNGATNLAQVLDLGMLNTGDEFYTSGAIFEYYYKETNSNTSLGYASTPQPTNCSSTSYGGGKDGFRVTTTGGTFVKGTSGTLTATLTYDKYYDWNGMSGWFENVTDTFTISYDGNQTVTYSYSSTWNIPNTALMSSIVTTTDITGDSTKSALGNPMYIDLDIGECYNTDYGTAVSVNNNVTLPAELPTLPSGATTITFDNTFTKVDIVPRWWKV